MSQIFVVLVCVLPIIIAQRNGQPRIITNDMPLRGRMPPPKEPGKLRSNALYQRSRTGRYNMRFNPQTGQMEMMRIGDVPASSTGGTPAVASGPLANAGVAAVLSVICSFEISSLRAVEGCQRHCSYANQHYSRSAGSTGDKREWSRQR